MYKTFVAISANAQRTLIIIELTFPEKPKANNNMATKKLKTIAAIIKPFLEA